MTTENEILTIAKKHLIFWQNVAAVSLVGNAILALMLAISVAYPAQ